jgi:DNA invertase Pin-like site-specific DNA recombinase
MNEKSTYRCALYIRLSREDGDKEESDSVGNQRRLLQEFAEKREDMIVSDCYIDEGYSGTNFNRPAFQKMMTDIMSEKITCVIVKDLSRFGRDYIETGRYLERIFPKQGVRFISITDNIDSIKQVYDILLPIKNIFNEQYAKDISQKIHAVVKSKQQAGEFIGAFASYGYRKSPTNKNKLIIDSYAATVVQKIFSWYIQGMGKATIAKQLNREGVLCPSEYKRLNGENYVNHNRLATTTYWTYPTIHMILQNEMYAGNMVQGKKNQQMRSKQRQISKEEWIVVKDTHEPIISPKIWKKTQSLLQKRTRSLDLKENSNPFGGFLKCGDCGRSMCKSISYKKDGSKRYYFYCGTYKRAGKQFCSPHPLPYDVIENMILRDLNILLHHVSGVEALLKNEFDRQQKHQMPASELALMRKELEKLARYKKSAYHDYQDGLLPQNEYINYHDDYQAQEALLRKKIILVEESSKKKEDDIFERPWLKRLFEQKQFEVLEREMVTTMVNQITVYEQQRISISYRFSNELSLLLSQ